MCTICFYQDSRHELPLHWIRNVFEIGYVSRRNDGMSELRINGFRQTHAILAGLYPFLRFKKKQAEAMIKATKILCDTTGSHISTKDSKIVADCIIAIQDSNYVTRRKKTREEVYKILDLTP